MANLYLKQFERGLSDPPTIGQARRVRRDYVVSSRFKRRNGRDLPVEWRVREFPNTGSLVIDMMVGGTSFLLLQRDEFNAIMLQSGAEGILSHMRLNYR